MTKAILDMSPDATPSSAPQQPATEEEVGASTPEGPEVSEPEPTPATSYPEPTGVDKILVETMATNGSTVKLGQLERHLNQKLFR